MAGLPNDATGVRCRDSALSRPKRAQVSKACHRCRRLQKGCSASRPCQRCIRVGLEDQCIRNEELEPQMAVDRNWSYPQVPPASVSTETLLAVPRTLATGPQPPSLPPASVVSYCFRRFFAALYPTIPILTPEYADLMTAEAESPGGGEAECLVTAVCAVVLIRVEEPNQRLFQEEGIPHSNSEFGKLLFEKAMAAHHQLSSEFVPCLERALSTFFLYTGHASLFHHSQAFHFLRDAATLWLVLRIDESDSLRRRLADRLFWVILVSERSHGIRYRRPITLQVTPTAPDLNEGEGAGSPDAGLTGLRNLVALFRPLDTPFFALLNQEDTLFGSRVPASLEAIQSAVRGGPEPHHSRILCETQLANLEVTRLWLLVILWQLRLRLGLLEEELGTPGHLTLRYPVNVGEELVGVIRGMSLGSISIHGVGINEKVFDITCAMVDVLSRVPATDKSRTGSENIRYLRQLIHQLPGGASTYDALLDNHISNALPSFLGSPGVISDVALP
ncbi:hypothetical protein N657DRAFT_649249 [Parathielavia appendiculata]|uniref:Zn(2)-C6 fungal-type domain-containing protein n=1 Tax=Parathielavia appendiculata TaxID=2587402 RepID=A0AAN6TT08_9PEZI|nr:hypothetical protein N657DRAFT_649249 [Parathielavia appendiculata]